MKKFEKLNRSEMKNVLGGVAAPPTGGPYTCMCQCNGPGSWNATYGSTQAAKNAIGAYCSMGGSCMCTSPA